MSVVEIPNVDLFEELGRGAFSVVYRARRANKSCAVKLPRDVGSQSSRRFRNEAIALARANHPVLPAVWEVGDTAGTPFLVMELCEGETLAHRLAHGALPFAQIVDFGRQLASALGEIHKMGLVHCDVKPQNIIVDASGRVRLVDFGLAASRDTGSLVRAGTMPYAAPEQMAENYQQVDGRADLYGLGSVLYECLEGEPPAQGARLGSPGPGGYSSGVRLRRAAGSGSSSEPSSSEPPLPRQALLAIVSRLLEPDPDDRYPSATALEYDLNRLEELGNELAKGREPALNLRQLDKPLVVGRDRQLASLDQAWHEARGGDGRVVLVRGVAGSGKTSLVRAFQCEVARLGGTVLYAAGTRYGTKPFAVMSALVEGYLESAVTEEQRVAYETRLREACGEFGRLLKVLSPVLGRVFADAPPIPRSDDAQHVFIEGLAEAALRISRAVAPSVLFIDDVQWLDAASASVLKSMSARIDAQPTIMLLAARDEPPAITPIDPIIDAAARSDLLTIQLEPLNAQATRELIAKFLSTSPTDDLVAWVSGINDGTPFNAVQILRSLLDEGLLVPHLGAWRLEPGALEHARLPQRTMEILTRRIRQLSPTCREALAGAAVLGASFPISVLPHLTQLSESDVLEALAEAQQAMLVQARPHQSLAFVHDSVREALLAGFVADRAPELNRRAAEAYEALAASGKADTSDPGFAYALAGHYAAAGTHAGDGAIAANLRAAHMAFTSFDNYNAIRFFQTADAASRNAGKRLDPRDRGVFGEALLRIGHLPEGLAEVESALQELKDPVERANALMRVAWAHMMQFNTEKAWPALDVGFQSLGEKLPTERPGGLALATVAHYRPRKRHAPIDIAERPRIEALWNLCERGYQLAAETGRPLTLLQLAFKMLDVGERLGPSAQQSRSHACYGFVLVVLGFRHAGITWLAHAQASADALGEPSTQGWIHQVRALGLVWAGDAEGALAASARCLLDYGSWRGLHEYSFFAWNQQAIEALHGRYLEGWAWLKRAIQKIDQHPGHPVIPELTALGARATLVALGREREIPSILEKLSRASAPTNSTSDYQLGLIGSRVRFYTERGDLGPEFESIVAEFTARAYNPKRAPLIVGEYCVNVAHARVDACLRASADRRGALLPALKEALKDLRSAARIPLYDAHRLAIEAYWAWFKGDTAKAEHWFEKARELSERERIPWVLYSVHRGRAHLLRASGRLDSALVHARMAELIARQNGAAYRLRWISEEFALGDAHLGNVKQSAVAEGTTTTSPITQSRQRRQLRALLRLSQVASADTNPESLLQVVLDELVRAAGASSGIICSRDAEGDLSVVAACDVNGPMQVTVLDKRSSTVVESALRANRSVRADDTVELVSRMAVPLRTSTESPACICLQAAGCGIFNEEDAAMLETLAAQAGVTLALSRSLRVQNARTQASQAVQQQQAVDLLLGGVAQDLDRVLEEVQSSLDSTWVPLPQEQEALLRSTQRARQLAQQLLSLAQQSGGAEELNLNEAVEASRPALERIVRRPLELRVELGAALPPVHAQRILVEQLLTNLALAARQLTTESSVYVIETRATEIDAELGNSLHVSPGAYGLLTVSLSGADDTAPGERRSMLSHSPGLWLAGAFAPAFQNRGGRLIVTNDRGVGASFSVLLPSARPERSHLITAGLQGTNEVMRRRVVLVEPDTSMKGALAQALEAVGLQTYAFIDGRQAVDFVRNDDGEIALVMTAATGEGVSGPETTTAIQRMEPDAHVMYISNHAAGLLRWREVVHQDATVLVMPLSAARVAERAVESLRRPKTNAMSA